MASVESTSNASLVGAMPTALTRGRGLWRRRTGALRVGGRSADIGPERLYPRRSSVPWGGVRWPAEAEKPEFGAPEVYMEKETGGNLRQPLFGGNYKWKLAA